MGTGAIVIGLASIVIGEVLLGRLRSFGSRLISAVVGSVVYFLIRAIVLQLGMDANDMKLLSAVIVALALCVPVANQQMEESEVPIRKEEVTMLELHNVKKTFNKGTINEKKALQGWS